MVKMLEKRSDGIVIFELKNDDVCVQLMNLGAHILSVFTKDQNGQENDSIRKQVLHLHSGLFKGIMCSYDFLRRHKVL